MNLSIVPDVSVFFFASHAAAGQSITNSLKAGGCLIYVLDGIHRDEFLTRLDRSLTPGSMYGIFTYIYHEH